MTTHKTNPRLLILAAFVLVGGAIGCSAGPKSVQASYQVIGSAGVTSASVTYLSGAGVSTGAVSVALPWNYPFTGYETEGTEKGSVVYLSAQNNSNTGSVTVIINEAGQVFQQSWATMPQAAITIQGSF